MAAGPFFVRGGSPDVHRDFAALNARETGEPPVGGLGIDYFLLIIEFGVGWGGSKNGGFEQVFLDLAGINVV